MFPMFEILQILVMQNIWKISKAIVWLCLNLNMFNCSNIFILGFVKGLGDLSADSVWFCLIPTNCVVWKMKCFNWFRKGGQGRGWGRGRLPPPTPQFKALTEATKSKSLKHFQNKCLMRFEFQCFKSLQSCNSWRFQKMSKFKKRVCLILFVFECFQFCLIFSFWWCTRFETFEERHSAWFLSF